MLMQVLHVETEMKNLNLQVTLLVQRCGTAVPTTLHPCVAARRWRHMSINGHR